MSFGGMFNGGLYSYNWLPDEEEENADREVARVLTEQRMNAVAADADLIREADDEAVVPDRVPLTPSAPSSRGPAFSGAGYEQSKTQAPGFDWRRAIVAAGKGDVRQYDANKLRREQAPLLEEQRRSARARLDPASPESKRAQDDFAAQLRLYSQIPGVPDGLKSEIEAMSANVGSMHEAQIERAAQRYDRIFGTAMRGVHEQGLASRAAESLKARKDASAAASADRRAALGLQRESLNVRLKELADRRAEREDNRTEADVSALGKANAPLDVMETTLQKARALKPKVNTGLIADTLQQIAKKAGLASADFVTLEQLVQTVDNEITLLQSGGAVSDGEAARLRKQLATLNDDDEDFDIKLSAMLETIRLKKQANAAAHPRAAAAKRQPAAGAAGETFPAKPDKTALAKRALADPKAPAAAKAKAKEILDAAGITY